MDPLNLQAIIITLVVVVVGTVVATGYRLLLGPRGLLKKPLYDKVRELEVVCRMARGDELLEKLRELAKLYRQIDRPYDADQCYKRAIQIAELERGEKDPTTVALLEEYAALLSKGRRKREAKKVKGKIKERKRT